MKMKLTAPAVERLKAPERQTDYFDTTLPGFALRVTPRGVRSWVVFYRVDGALRRDTLGRYSAAGLPAGLTLAQARKKAGEVFDAVAEGRDPRAEKAEAKAATATAAADTYAMAVDDFIKKWAIAKKHNRRWKEQRRLLLNASAGWHKRPVSEITVRDAYNVLDGLMAAGKGYTANRTYEALATFFKWAYRRDRIPANIMDKVDRPFDGEKRRERHWNDAEVRAIWKADKLDAFEGAYLRLLLLLAPRRNELAGMRWEEVDLEAATWRLPASRAKAKREHLYPLPGVAVELLEALPRIAGTPWVFPGRLHHMTVGTKIAVRVREASGVEDFRFDTARHTLRTGLDRLGIQPHVKDECMNHARRGVGDRHYSEYDYIDEQRVAFEAWARHVLEVPPQNVVPLSTRTSKSATITNI